jgi:hypothetical protein
MNHFTPNPDPSTVDILSPDLPLLIVEDLSGQTYEGQSGGVSCNHHSATGVVFNIVGAQGLKEYLDGTHHARYCGYIDEEGLAYIDGYFKSYGMPLHTTSGYNEEGWISVTIAEDIEMYCSQWAYLQPYEGRSAILVWNNCD